MTQKPVTADPFDLTNPMDDENEAEISTQDVGSDAAAPRKLMSVPKDINYEQLKAVDKAGDEKGYNTRKQRRGPGRPKSKYGAFLHLRVLPSSKEWFMEEAIRLEVQQGVLMRRMVDAYIKDNPDACELPDIPTY